MAGEAGWDQTVQVFKSMFRSLDTRGGACCGLAGLLGMTDLCIWSFMPFFPSPMLCLPGPQTPHNSMPGFVSSRRKGSL